MTSKKVSRNNSLLLPFWFETVVTGHLLASHWGWQAAHHDMVSVGLYSLIKSGDETPGCPLLCFQNCNTCDVWTACVVLFEWITIMHLDCLKIACTTPLCSKVCIEFVSLPVWFRSFLAVHWPAWHRLSRDVRVCQHCCLSDAICGNLLDACLDFDGRGWWLTAYCSALSRWWLTSYQSASELTNFARQRLATGSGES